MKKAILLSITALLLSSCTTSNDNTTLSNDDHFTKKKECSALQTEIESRIERDWNDEVNAWLDKIFYSPTKNTCMYTMKKRATIGGILIEICKNQRSHKINPCDGCKNTWIADRGI